MITKNKIKICKYCKKPIIFEEHNWRYDKNTKKYYHVNCFLQNKKII